MTKKKAKSNVLQMIPQKNMRPQEYDLNKNFDLVEEFLLRVCSNEPTKDILADVPKEKKNKGKKFFHISTFYKLMMRHPEFKELYYDAKAIGAQMDAEDMRQIADSCNGKSSAEVQKARLMVDTRKFIAMSLLPKRYGTAIKVEKNVTEEKVVDSKQINDIVNKVRKSM